MENDLMSDSSVQNAPVSEGCREEDREICPEEASEVVREEQVEEATFQWGRWHSLARSLMARFADESCISFTAILGGTILGVLSTLPFLPVTLKLQFWALLAASLTRGSSSCCLRKRSAIAAMVEGSWSWWRGLGRLLSGPSQARG